MERKLVSSGAIFESQIGFSRALRVGPYIAVSGTAPIAPDGGTACPSDLYGQTMHGWEEAGRAHGEFFKGIRPASTMIQIVQAIDPSWLVEIEADAIVM